MFKVEQRMINSAKLHQEMPASIHRKVVGEVLCWNCYSHNCPETQWRFTQKWHVCITSPGWPRLTPSWGNLAGSSWCAGNQRRALDWGLSGQYFAKYSTPKQILDKCGWKWGKKYALGSPKSRCLRFAVCILRILVIPLPRWGEVQPAAMLWSPDNSTIVSGTSDATPRGHHCTHTSCICTGLLHAHTLAPRQRWCNHNWSVDGGGAPTLLTRAVIEVSRSFTVPCERMLVRKDHKRRAISWHCETLWSLYCQHRPCGLDWVTTGCMLYESAMCECEWITHIYIWHFNRGGRAVVGH